MANLDTMAVRWVPGLPMLLSVAFLLAGCLPEEQPVKAPVVGEVIDPPAAEQPAPQEPPATGTPSVPPPPPSPPIVPPPAQPSPPPVVITPPAPPTTPPPVTPPPVVPEPEPTPQPVPTPKPPVVVTPPPAEPAPPTPAPPQPAGNPYVNASLIPAPASGSGEMRIRPTDRRHGTPDGPTPNGDGQFRFVCNFSHMAFDDPIVYPGQKDAAHLHVFWGNTRANFASTTTSLMTTGNGSCEGGIANRSSYWVPAVIDTATGRPLKPSTIIVYYKSHGHTRIADYVAPPTGLRMVVGKKQADWNRIADTDTTLRMMCTVDWGASDYYEYIPNCKGGPDTRLQFMVSFYGCWDGKNLDSPDHRSHMAMPVNGRCPPGHPVPIPEVTQNIYYDVPTGTNTSKWRLSSDAYSTGEPGGYSMHADVWLAWDEQVSATWTQRCIRDGFDCHAQLLGDDTEMY